MKGQERFKTKETKGSFVGAQILIFKTFRKNDTPTKYLCSGHAGLLQEWYVNQLQNEVR